MHLSIIQHTILSLQSSTVSDTIHMLPLLTLTKQKKNKKKKMRPKQQLQLLLYLFFTILPIRTSTKSVIEPCNSSDSCTALISYVLPWDLKVSKIASRFNLNVTDILTANAIEPTNPTIQTHILPKNSLLKVPISCPCVSGIRWSVSTTYSVRAADTVDSISDGFGGLVSADQIRSLNGIYGRDGLTIGETIAIPLPCTCFNNSDNGVPTVYMLRVVRRGEGLRSIGREYGTTVMDLKAINGLAQEVVEPGDVLSVPIPACSSANLNWMNESLIVPNGSYALTANNCVRCIYGTTDLNLRCYPSGLATACSHLSCKGTKLFIGDVHETRTPIGCNISACVYRGHLGKIISRSLINTSQLQCTGNRDDSTMSPSTSPTFQVFDIPVVTMSPSPTPSAMPNSSVTIIQSNPTSKQHSNTSNDGRPSYN